jgi:D-tyrosyl-tRNA(Tyr) deacylase
MIPEELQNEIEKKAEAYANARLEIWTDEWRECKTSFMAGATHYAERMTELAKELAIAKAELIIQKNVTKYFGAKA